MQATFNNSILIPSPLCNFISVNISGFLISNLLKRDLTFLLSKDLTGGHNCAERCGKKWWHQWNANASYLHYEGKCTKAQTLLSATWRHFGAWGDISKYPSLWEKINNWAFCHSFMEPKSDISLSRIRPTWLWPNDGLTVQQVTPHCTLSNSTVAL